MTTSGDESADWAEGTPEGRRVIELLWSPHAGVSTGRGPKPKLSLPEVVRAGIKLADAEGLAALSMRKVANELGVGAMSLYTYLPGRSELIELMIDTVYGEKPLPDTGLPWRARIDDRSRQLWLLYQAHPWVLDHNLARLPMGPNVLDSEEALLAAIAAAGVPPRQVPVIYNVITWHLFGMARAQISDAVEARHTGVSAEAYYLARSSFWVTYFDPDRYPTMAAVHASGGFDDPENWDFETMLTRLLDAIELLVETSAAPG